jgi:hypothetical protein
MDWSFEVFRAMIAEFFDKDEDDITMNTTVSNLNIERDDLVDFLVDNKDKIEAYDVKLKNEGTLRLEIKQDRTIYDLAKIMME